MLDQTVSELQSVKYRRLHTGIATWMAFYVGQRCDRV